MRCVSGFGGQVDDQAEVQEQPDVGDHRLAGETQAAGDGRSAGGAGAVLHLGITPDRAVDGGGDDAVALGQFIGYGGEGGWKIHGS